MRTGEPKGAQAGEPEDATERMSKLRGDATGLPSDGFHSIPRFEWHPYGCGDGVNEKTEIL